MAARKLKKPMIPDDLVGEILQGERFSPKSLARFVSVSEKWRSIILNQISDRNREEEKFLLISTSSIKSIDVTEPEIKAVTVLEFPVKHNFYVIGSVNGLVLYLDSENRALILFNAWTQLRQTIKISHLDRSPLTPDYYVYGFGYEKSNENYVIVLINREDYNGFAWSSKTQNWVPLPRSLDPVLWKSFYYMQQLPSMTVELCVNECIYWQLNSGVLCFDLKTYESNTIEEPKSMQETHNYVELVVLRDRLAAVEFIFDLRIRRRCTRVWELYGQMQWIEIMTIPRFIVSGDDAACYQSHFKKMTNDISYEHAVFFELMSPVLWLKNGDLILVSSSYGCNRNRTLIGVMRNRGPGQGRFYLYNEERKTFNRLKTPDISIQTGDVMIPYKNNLFSPMLKEDEDEDGGGRHQVQDHMESV